MRAGLIALSLLAQFAVRAAPAQTPAPILDKVAFEITAIDDSAGYLVYHYRLSNSRSSRGAVGWVHFGLTADSGTKPVVLASTGEFHDASTGGLGPATPHVPVGFIVPDHWSGYLWSNALVVWAARQGYTDDGPFSDDSVAAGGSKKGFGLRSPYLPGIRRFSAEPTLGVCCRRPKPGSGEYPSTGEFRVSDTSVAPTVRPEALTLETVGSDLQHVCGSLRWIPDRIVCDRLRSSLRGPQTKQALSAFLQELDNQHGPGKPVNDNAYWLLKVNAAHLLAEM